MKIDEKYSNRIIQLTNSTERAIRKLGFTEYNLKLLNKEKQSLLQMLQQYSTQKEAVITELSTQYGQGYLNPDTWEFTKKQQEVPKDI